MSADLLGGLAALIAETGVGSWRPDGSAYAPEEVPIALGALPGTTGRGIALALYGSADDQVHADSVRMVQVRLRGDSDIRTVDRMSDDLFDALHGRTRFTLAGVPVIEAHRQSTALLGRDDNGRWERTDNYYLQTHTPTTHRKF